MTSHSSSLGISTDISLSILSLISANPSTRSTYKS